jgi:thioredoxin 1
MITIDTEVMFDQLLKAPGIVLADFYADWCAPCKYLDEVLERLEIRLPDGVSIVKIDSDGHPELSRRYHVMSVPVLVLFKSGQEVWRMNGFHLEDELLEIITRVSRETV